ncbi:MAG: hypothetical protein HYY40_10070 [Bacteroidetes bacterium]|nr:hypothetical protein [Bacteroidota bacterium]
MKNSLFILTLLFASHITFGQKVKDEDVSVKYKRLPSNPIDKSITKYTGKVYLAYAEGDRKIAEEYDKNKSAADQKFAEEKKEYKDKSASDKFFEKVVLNEDNKPKKEFVEKPYIRKTSDENLLATSYIKLEGFEKTNDANLVITFIVHGLERNEPVINQKKSTSVSTGSGSGQQQISYTMDIKYRNPVSVKVETTDGNLILNEAVEKANEYRSWQSASYSSEDQARSSVKPENAIAPFEQKLIEDNLKLANELLNAKCAVTTAERKMKLYNVESKKGDYNDFSQAFIAASEGYAMVIANNEEAQKKLKEAIELWEKAMKESNPKDKKARINEEVTIALIFNLTEAYLWINDYSKSKLTATRGATLDLSKKEKTRLEELKTFCDDQNQRYDANAGK